MGATCNVLIAVLALLVSRVGGGSWRIHGEVSREAPQPASEPDPTATGEGHLLGLLFATGLTSMGMEVVWVREFTPYIGTVAAAFASILAVYLIGTFVGSPSTAAGAPGIRMRVCSGLCWRCTHCSRYWRPALTFLR